jgi:hypothetical protein
MVSQIEINNAGFFGVKYRIISSEKRDRSDICCHLQIPPGVIYVTQGAVSDRQVEVNLRYFRGISFINNRKRIGPKTVPWETPFVTTISWDLTERRQPPLSSKGMSIDCLLPNTKTEIQLKYFHLIFSSKS